MSVLARLIKAYPDLNIVALVDKRVVNDNSSYAYACADVDKNAPHIEYVYRGKKAIYRKMCHDSATIFENEVGVLTLDNEDKFVDFCKHIEWEKVIIVYVDGVANE